MVARPVKLTFTYSRNQILISIIHFFPGYIFILQFVSLGLDAILASMEITIMTITDVKESAAQQIKGI